MIAHLVKHPFFTLWVTQPHPDPSRKPLKVPVHWDGTTKHSLANPAPLLSHADALMFAAVTGCQIGFRPHPSTRICCIDLDNCIDGQGNWSAEALAVHAMLPGAAVEYSVSGRGLHFWFSYTGPGWGKRGRKGTPLGDIDLFSSADAFVALGTYREGDASVDLTTECQTIVDLCFPAASAGPRKMSPEWEAKSPDEQARSLADLRAALAATPSDDRDEWVKVGQCLVELGDAGWELWNEWSAKSAKYNEGDAERVWAGLSGQQAGYAGVFRLAERYGWANRRGVDPAAAFKPVAALPAGALAEAPPTTGVLQSPAGEGKLKSRVYDIALVLRANEKQLRIARDEFKSRIMFANGDRVPRVAEEEDYIHLAEKLEGSYFSSIEHNTLKRACKLVARENKFDSAIDWANSLTWDGVGRIEHALMNYFGCADTPYARAVGQYLFTALAGRCLEPGCQADMAVVFVGGQGLRKSTTIQELVPTSEAYVYVSFSDSDKELSMRVKGRLLVEIPEMKGMANKEVQHIRDWITRRYEQWRGMHADDISEYRRRFVIVGTANGRELLSDPEGNRRWLPIDAGACNPEALARDRDQLWAEGISIWRKSGVRWREAEYLARDVHEGFTVEDAWEPRILKWLGETVFDKDRAARYPGSLNCDAPFSPADVLQFALGMSVDKFKPSDSQRVGVIMSKLGMRKIRPLIDGKQLWRYIK